MPILLVLLVAVACLPVPWPAPPFGLDASESAALTVAVMAFPLVAAALLSWWLVVSLRYESGSRSDLVQRFGRFRRWLGYANLVAAGFAIVACGWGWTVWNTLILELPGSPNRVILAPGAELAVPGPYFLSLLIGWFIYYPADRAIHRTSRRAEPDAAFWSLPKYLLFRGRQFVLFVLLTPLSFTVYQGFLRIYPDLAQNPWMQAASVVGVMGLFIIFPRVLKTVLGWRQLPAGHLRDRLERTARRLGLRYAELLLWPTNGAMANAMVMGLIPWARYVVFTDRLLDEMDPDELDAVLGHEVGHVHHRHILYYAAFLTISLPVIVVGIVALQEKLSGWGVIPAGDWNGWIAAVPFAVLGLYLFLVFGLLSRRCERQADMFGCRSVSCPDPRCERHDEMTVLVSGGQGLCPTGVKAMIRALDRVAVLTGLDGPVEQNRRLTSRIWAVVQAWQHGPITDRIEFLYRLADDPSLAARTDRRVTWFRWGLMLLLFAVLAGLGMIVGWSKVWAAFASM